MWGRINASLPQVAQGDSSYLMYKSVPLPVDLGSGAKGKADVNWEVDFHKEDG